MFRLLLICSCTHFHLFHKLKHLLWWQASHSSANGLWCLLSWAAVSIWWLNNGSSGAQTSGNKQAQSTLCISHFKSINKKKKRIIVGKQTISVTILTLELFFVLLTGGIVHTQSSATELSTVEVTHGAECRLLVLVLTEAITFWFSCFSVIYQPTTPVLLVLWIRHTIHAASGLMVIPETDDKTNFWEDVFQLLFCCFIWDITH